MRRDSWQCSDDLRSVLQGFAQGLSGHLSSLKEIVEGQVETLEEAVRGLEITLEDQTRESDNVSLVCGFVSFFLFSFSLAFP